MMNNIPITVYRVCGSFKHAWVVGMETKEARTANKETQRSQAGSQGSFGANSLWK